MLILLKLNITKSLLNQKLKKKKKRQKQKKQSFEATHLENINVKQFI